ncbi:MAG TPA: hypothetical protein VFJ24_09650 [Gaiellales bacterium]|nr:hypothetical protein [Gaiellales bacterium]
MPARRHRQREVAAHAEPDHADLAGATLALGQPVSPASSSLRDRSRRRTVAIKHLIRRPQ